MSGDKLDKAMGASRSGPARSPEPETGQDARLTRDSRAHEGLERARDDGRTDRSVSENRELTDDDRLEMFRNSFFQSALPDLPPIPGFHICWLTTTNPRDTLQMRSRVGYTPIQASEVPGWEHVSPKSGEYAGLIMVNEMLAAKLPESLYQRFMAEVHHHLPNSEDEKIRYQLDQMKEQASATKGRLVVEEGMEEFSKPRKTPVFAD